MTSCLVGVCCVMIPYVTQRHPALWENPDEFAPERFAAEAFARRPRFAYFPFGGGHANV